MLEVAVAMAEVGKRHRQAAKDAVAARRQLQAEAGKGIVLAIWGMPSSLSHAVFSKCHKLSKQVHLAWNCLNKNFFDHLRSLFLCLLPCIAARIAFSQTKRIC